MLKHLKHTDIDKDRWDKTIEISRNKVIYGKSWFLDTVSPGWEAVIDEDYSCIMPLPVKEKWGYRYIVQPVFTKQLGVFSATNLSQSVIDDFMHYTNRLFKYIRLYLNRDMVLYDYGAYKTEMLNNHELSLKNTYEILRKNYKRRTSLNLNRAIKNGVVLKEINDINIFKEFAYKNINYFTPKKRKEIIAILLKLILAGKDEIDIEIRGAYVNEDLISLGLFFIGSDRIYNMLNVSNSAGHKTQAMYFLTDQVIKDYAGKNILLDFTGSNQKGIAYFLESFGAKPFQYSYIEYKNVRTPYKWFIR